MNQKHNRGKIRDGRTEPAIGSPAELMTAHAHSTAGCLHLIPPPPPPQFIYQMFYAHCSLAESVWAQMWPLVTDGGTVNVSLTPNPCGWPKTKVVLDGSPLFHCNLSLKVRDKLILLSSWTMVAPVWNSVRRPPILSERDKKSGQKCPQGSLRLFFSLIIIICLMVHYNHVWYVKQTN